VSLFITAILIFTSIFLPVSAYEDYTANIHLYEMQEQ